MPSRCAAAASRPRSRCRSPGAPGKARVSSLVSSLLVTSLLPSFRSGGTGVAAPERGDAVGGGPAGRVRAAANDGGDVGIGQARPIVVSDGLFLFGGQPGDRPREVAIPAPGPPAPGRGPPPLHPPGP